MQTARKALIVIDIQNDYFPNGNFPLENAAAACARTLDKINEARKKGWLVVGIRHSSPKDFPLFAEGSRGAELHPEMAAALAHSTVLVKRHADSFLDTGLAEVLSEAGVTDVYLAGMMTQNCVTFTAFSAHARGLNVHILADCCAAPTDMLHQFALAGLGDCFDVIR